MPKSDDAQINSIAELLRIWFYRNDFDSWKAATEILGLASGSQPSRCFWVIERFESQKSAGYWNGMNSRSFVSDIDAAVQFRRKEDALPIRSSWHWNDVQITEHVIIEPVTAPAGDTLGERLETAIEAWRVSRHHECLTPEDSEDLMFVLLALCGAPAGDLVSREEAAKVADRWANSHSCDAHDYDPCCHVRTGVSIAELIRALPTYGKKE